MKNGALLILLPIRGRAVKVIYRMKRLLLPAFLILLASTFQVQAGVKGGHTQPVTARQHLLMDVGWRFTLGNACDPSKDFGTNTGYFSYFAKAGYGDGAASPAFDDRAWRVIDLPHDWAVELPFDPNGSSSHGYKPLGKRFPATSIGWYRKSFFIPDSDFGKRVGIQFDGVFRNSEVWVNGFYLGQEKSGYSSFQYDITDYLNYGGTNVVAVRVDATMEEGWFYEGAGIYRDVWLNITSPLHIAPWGMFVSSDVKENSADVTARATITNDGTNEAVFIIRQTILDAKGKEVAHGELNKLTLEPRNTKDFSTVMAVRDPNLWSVESPYLYELVTDVYSGDSLVDNSTTKFGMRTLRFDPNKGFFLNGKHIELKGTNDHQDFAGVGTAVPDPLQVFRVERLKAMGSNAIRCSHNPPAPAFLDVCDSLGMLVIDENRLMGTSPEQLNQLERMIIRDRNHPSIILWSIGNEEWAIEGNVKGARIASDMQDFAHRLDPTRPTTAACSGGWGHGISRVIQVMGYNYIFNGNIDEHHGQFPSQPAVGTEESTSPSTRGIYITDAKQGHMEQGDRSAGDRGIEVGLKFYEERPFLSGLFFWTGFDYRGEPNPFGWPQVTSQSGILDLCGFPKDIFYYLKSWWTDKPVLHLLPYWNWAGKNGQDIDVWAYSNCDSVGLFLNGQSLGGKPVPKYSHVDWKVKYEPGTLLAKGYKDGKEVATDKVETTGEPYAVKLVPDRININADGEDVSTVTVEVVDSKGRIVPTAGNEIAFTIKGPGKIIGVGNGDPSSHEPDRYFESVSSAKISTLRIKPLSSAENPPEVAPGYDDSNWSPAFVRRDRESRIAQDCSKYVAIRGSFDLPAFTPETGITLLTKSIAQVQDIYVNGHLIAKGVQRDAPGQTYRLDHSILHEGTNVYAVVGPPLVKHDKWEALNTDPGMVQILDPAAQWKRSAFNGLAQVIVQSTKHPGEIVLTAASQGLTGSSVKIQTEPAVIQPEVPAAESAVRP